MGNPVEKKPDLSPPPEAESIVNAVEELNIEEAAEAEETSIPVLPDEMWLKILRKVPLEYREHLCLTSNKFRQLDLDLDNHKLKEIFILWNEDRQNMIGSNADSEVSIIGDKANPIQRSYRTSRIFRNSHADLLVIKMYKPNCTEAEFRLILNSLRTVTFQNLSVTYSDQDCDVAEQFFHDLVRDRDAENLIVSLSLGCKQRIGRRRNVPSTRWRTFLARLPKMGQLSLDCFRGDETNEDAIDDDMLLHLIERTNVLELDPSARSLTAAEILAAFEVISQSERSRYVSFTVTASANDALFATPSNFGRSTGGGLGLRDRARRSVLQSIERGQGLRRSYQIRMFKVGATGATGPRR